MSAKTPEEMSPEDILTFDLVVIGGGPAGASGANAGGLLGKTVAIIEQAPHLGGAGINTGTIPSKTLRETALVLSGWRSRRLFGVDLSLRRQATVSDFMRHEHQVTAAERQRLEARLDERGVTRFHGVASFLDPHTVRVLDQDGVEMRIRGDTILIDSYTRRRNAVTPENYARSSTGSESRLLQ